MLSLSRYAIMNIEYTDHALDRLRERHITKKQVKEAILNGRIGDTDGGKKQAVHRTKNKVLTVIYNIGLTKDKKPKVIIVTSY